MGKFVINKTQSGQFRFNLKAGNGQTILTSQTYTTLDACKQGIASVKKNSSKATAFKVETAKNGKPYFNLKAANGEIIGTSQMYSSMITCKNGIDSVQKNAPEAEIIISEK